MLKVLTFITTDFLDILKTFFMDTLPSDIQDVIVECVNKKGYFRQDPYANKLEIIRTRFVIDQIISNMNNNMMMIDADVVFNKQFSCDIEKRLLETDILFQDNEGWYNFGVFAFRCNENILNLFKELLKRLELNNNPDIHDQHIINNILKENLFNISSSSLPLTYFGGHFNSCKFPNFPNEEVYLYHATNTYSMKEKLEILNHVKNKFRK